MRVFDGDESLEVSSRAHHHIYLIHRLSNTVVEFTSAVPYRSNIKPLSIFPSYLLKTNMVIWCKGPNIHSIQDDVLQGTRGGVCYKKKSGGGRRHDVGVGK